MYTPRAPIHNTPALVQVMAWTLTGVNIQMKGQSEIAYLPKFAIIMLIVMVIVITDIL